MHTTTDYIDKIILVLLLIAYKLTFRKTEYFNLEQWK